MPQVGNTDFDLYVSFMTLKKKNTKRNSIASFLTLFPISTTSLKSFDTYRLPELPFFIESGIPNVSCFDKILYEYRYIGAYACIYAHIHMF